MHNIKADGVSHHLEVACSGVDFSLNSANADPTFMPQRSHSRMKRPTETNMQVTPSASWKPLLGFEMVFAVSLGRAVFLDESGC